MSAEVPQRENEARQLASEYRKIQKSWRLLALAWFVWGIAAVWLAFKVWV